MEALGSECLGMTPELKQSMDADRVLVLGMGITGYPAPVT